MDPSLLQRLWPVFVEEAREHLQEIGAGVLDLEKGTGRPGLLDAVRRTAHGLKGSAASLGLTDLERLAHGIESALANRSQEDRLEAPRVEALLAALDVAEAALRLGDAGRDPTVEGLATLLASLEPAAPASPTPPLGTAVEEVWPVFRAEAAEHLGRIKKAVGSSRSGRGFTGDDDDAVLARLCASLRSSAALLGARAMEERAARLGELLEKAGPKPSADSLAALASAVGELEAALQAQPDTHSIVAPSKGEPGSQTRGPGPLLGVFRKEAHEALEALELILKRLCSPDAARAEREKLVEEAVRRTHNLKGSAGGLGARAIAELAGRLEATLSRMAEPGLQASKGAAAAADDIVGLQQAVSQLGREPEPPAVLAEPAPAALGPADRTIRVSVHTLESVARQVEGFTLLRAREERRGRELTVQAGEVQATREQLRRLVELLRGVEAPAATELAYEIMGRLRAQERSLLRIAQEQAREAEQIRLVSTVAREDLRDLRMVPAGSFLEPLRRTVREVAGRLGKQVELSIAGGEVRLDRRILDELREPLQHLVRNAVDHGIEPASVRRAAGKRSAGSLIVRVERRGHRIGITVADDGVGISAEALRQVAVRRGLMNAEAAAQLTDEQALRLVFRPGFTTLETVTTVSGRGVGLDVVQAAAQKLRGTVELITTPGQGARFVLDLPLTLAAALAIVVRAGPDYAALPYESVERILLLTSADLGTVAGRASVAVEGAQLPFAPLAQLVGEETRQASLTKSGHPAVLVNAGGVRVVFAVDEIAGQHEVVVQPLGRHLSRTAHLAGAAVLDDGRVVSVLNAAEVARMARPFGRGAEADGPARPRILVVDDSLTTRSAMKAILEIAGYVVVPAADGDEALALLAQSACQLVVTDVQMPRMDGFTLTRRLKADPRLSSLPVIVVTSLDAPADRAAGLEAGADGFLVKRDVERGKLLELVRQLMPSRVS
jgi:two-component system chemotaxis sensor kinase CheA